jgi:hypothetical protein
MKKSFSIINIYSSTDIKKENGGGRLFQKEV